MRSKAAKITLWVLLGCTAALLLCMVGILIVDAMGGTGTTHHWAMPTFSTIFFVFLLALVFTYFVTEPSFKKNPEDEEELSLAKEIIASGALGEVESVIRITMLVALPAGFGMAVLSEPLLSIVYNGTNASNLVSIAAPILTVYGFGVFLFAVSSPIKNLFSFIFSCLTCLLWCALIKPECDSCKDYIRNPCRYKGRPPSINSKCCKDCLEHDVGKT